MTSYCRNLKYEDTVQCSIYSLDNISHISEWEKLLESINEFISLLSQEYIWHRDDLKLCMSIFGENNKDVPCFLTSTTCFGDNIEDEWFIVYLILEITKKYQNVIAQIEDNDGDFLLIEAENYLPSWANPDSTENRVFIYKGKIHFIDPSITPLNSTLQIGEALELMKEKSHKTEASSKIQQAILERIGNYPQKIQTICHGANVTLPIEIAAVLTLQPSLISPIVTSYCNLDSIDMKYCKDLQLNNDVMVKVKFTKYLYAMLLHSKPLKHGENKNTDIDKKKQLGIKLAYGYNIIKKTPTKDEFSSLEYKKFIKSLTNNGYFKNNLEGSKDYKELLAKANEYFLNIESSIPSHVNNLICKLQSTEEFKDLTQKLSSESDLDLSEDDDDDWLNVNPEQLNDFLSSKYGNDKNSRNETLTSQLTSFLNKTSDFEGIDKREDNLIDDDAIEFDAEEFVKSLEKMLKLVSNDSNVMDDIDSDDDDDEDDEILSDDINDLDEELTSKLHDPSEFGNRFHVKQIANNLRQSLREEDLSGPTSNILKTIGVNKTEVLDSDDE